MRSILLCLVLVACGDAPSETPAEPAKVAAQASESAPEKKAAPPKGITVSTSGDWEVPGDGIPAIDESDSRTLESGLTIITTQKGDGPEPVKGQAVTVHYHGWLADGGKLFDSSGKRGKPLDFMVGTGRVIKGWDQGLMELTQGSKARLKIPAALAYGSNGAGRVIGPDADLVFDVWLVGVGN